LGRFLKIKTDWRGNCLPPNDGYKTFTSNFWTNSIGKEDMLYRVHEVIVELESLLKATSEKTKPAKIIVSPTDKADKTEYQIPPEILQALENEKLITQNPLRWVGAVNLCAYFVDCYFAESNPYDLWQVGKNLFSVKHLRQSKYNYSGNKSTGGKPRGYRTIDKILQQYM